MSMVVHVIRMVDAPVYGGIGAATLIPNAARPAIAAVGSVDAKTPVRPRATEFYQTLASHVGVLDIAGTIQTLGEAR